MKAILNFKKGTLALWILISIFIVGCHEQPKPPPILQYVERDCPKITTLKRIPESYNVQDIKIEIKSAKDQPDYFLVKKDDLKKASTTSRRKGLLIKKQKRQINFYVNQTYILRKWCKASK